jgi:hypothetical protein
MESSLDLNKYDDRFVQLIGWGSSNKNGKFSQKLKRVAIQVFSQRYKVIIIGTIFQEKAQT